MKHIRIKSFIVGCLLLFLPALIKAQNTPPNLNSNISWSPANFNTVADIQAAFNTGRTGENTQLGSTLPAMTLPSQATWDGMSNSEKALTLINAERSARNVLPLEGVDLNVIGVAQAHANWLLANNLFQHTGSGGTSPSQRLAANPAIGGHQDFLSVSENLSAFVTSGTSIPLPVERSVYGWIYDDASSAWGHRIACLFGPFTNNFGVAGSEGFMGIGRASGGPWSGFGTPWNFAEIVVFNVFDPDATYNPALPVQLSTFTGSVTLQNQVRLRWTTTSEINNYGFYIERRQDNESQFMEIPNSFIAGHGTTNEPQQYSFTDNTIGASIRQYRLRQVDLDGTVHFSEPIQVSVLTTVQEQMPSEFALNQNYPNPFNPTTTIEYALPADARVTLEVFDVLGRRIAELMNGQVAAGYHDVKFDASALASGMYFYRLNTVEGNGKTFTQVRKLMLMK